MDHSSFQHSYFDQKNIVNPYLEHSNPKRFLKSIRMSLSVQQSLKSMARKKRSIELVLPFRPVKFQRFLVPMERGKAPL